jgi:nicotinamidase-related amidase
VTDQRPSAVDRTEFIDSLNDGLEINPARTALVTIDVHRGHLDPEIATLPATAELAAQVTAANGRICKWARSENIPIVHMLYTQRLLRGTSEMMSNPFFKAADESAARFIPDRESTLARHNVVGSPQAQLMPDLGPEPGDVIVDAKHRHSCYAGTDLEMTLRTLDVDTVLLTGINTNTCVLMASFETCQRDFAAVVVEDCVGSTYGDDLHYFALQNIARCIGWVLTSDEVMEKARSFAGAEPVAVR